MSRITVGALVRHRTLDAIGIVVEHSMWSAEARAAFRVKFNKPIRKGGIKDLAYLTDRADRWVLVSGCDNP